MMIRCLSTSFLAQLTGICEIAKSEPGGHTSWMGAGRRLNARFAEGDKKSEVFAKTQTTAHLKYSSFSGIQRPAAHRWCLLEQSLQGYRVASSRN